jgi:hypothetical protein
VTVGIPVALRCTPLVAAASGTYLARPVAGGLNLLSPGSLIPGWPLRRIAGVKAGLPGAIAQAGPPGRRAATRSVGDSLPERVRKGRESRSPGPRVIACRRTGGAGSGYPVASARSVSGADGTGYPRSLMTHHRRAQPWAISEPRPAGGTGLLILERLYSSV